MLQQTRVEAVIPYYRRWLARFPDWPSLAGATDDEVLLAWKGLGYYGRARNLHRTAQVVCERFGGRPPRDPRELRSLPGVGEYTAGAVASIAFGRKVPAVDGNVRRVLSRLLDVGDPTPARLRDEATRLIDPDRPGDFNEALMELGATICTPRSPRCDACPVADECGALAAGTVAERPLRRVRRRVPRVEYAVAVVVAEAPDAAGAAASEVDAPDAADTPVKPLHIAELRRGIDRILGVAGRPGEHVTVANVRLEASGPGTFRYVKGTIRNSGSTSFGGFPKVWARFYDAANLLVAQEFDYVRPAATFPAGAQQTFSIVLETSDTRGWAYYRLAFTVDDDRPISCAGCGEQRRSLQRQP